MFSCFGFFVAVAIAHSAYASTRLPILTPWLLSNRRLGLSGSVPPAPLYRADLSLDNANSSAGLGLGFGMGIATPPHQAQQQAQRSFQESLARVLAQNSAAPRLRALPREDLSVAVQFVSAKQFRRLWHRMTVRAAKRRMMMMMHRGAGGAHKHLSRQLHASRRVRGKGGRFLTKEEKEALAREEQMQQQLGGSAARAGAAAMTTNDEEEDEDDDDDDE